MASVYRNKTKNPNGVSVKRKTWMMKYTVNGKVIRESSETENKSEAKRLAEQRETDGAAGKPVGPKAGKLTLARAYQNIVDDYKLQGFDTSDKIEQMYTQHLEPFFGATTFMVRIDATRIKDYTVQRQEAGAANNTIRNELGMLKRMFTLGYELGALAINPYVAKPPEGKARRGFYEPAQFVELREAVRKKGDRYADIADVAYITGWRIDSEVTPLEWRHIDFAGRQIKLDPEMSKNDEGRVFPMTSDLEAIFKKWWAVHQEAARHGFLCARVFVKLVATARGGAAAASPKRPVPMRDFYKAWKSTCVERGYPDCVPHDFRRTAIRNDDRKGLRQKTSMKLRGHKTDQMFHRYNIVSESELQEARAVIDTAPAKA